MLFRSYVSYLNGINVSNISPNWKDSQKFYVNNNTDKTLVFNIKLTKVNNTFNPTSDLVYSLKRDGLRLYDKVNTPTTDTYIMKNIIIPGKTTYNYELEYEFIETGANQDYNKDKSFNAKVEIEAVN